MKVPGAAFLISLAIISATVGALAAPGGGSAAKSPDTDLKKLTVDVDTNGVAKTMRKDVIKKVANNHDEPPFMNGEPEHLRVLFDNDKVSDYTDYLQRQLLVYPLAPYSALFHGKEKTEFDRGSSELKKIIATKSDKGVKQIFILPSAEAAEMFRNHVKYLNFKQGSGVTFLTCYAQDDAPVKNGDFFYTFQGITSDGKYHVSFFCPVEVKNPPKLSSSKSAAQYLDKVADKDFKPSLTALDHMIETISLK